jgi:hypothetical protein
VTSVEVGISGGGGRERGAGFRITGVYGGWI